MRNIWSLFQKYLRDSISSFKPNVFHYCRHLAVWSMISVTLPMRSTPRVSVNFAIPSQPLQAGPGKSVRLNEEAHVLIINIAHHTILNCRFCIFSTKHVCNIFSIGYSEYTMKKIARQFNFWEIKLLFNTCKVK